MELQTAFTRLLGRHTCPVVTAYGLGVPLFQLYRAKTYEGEPLAQISKEIPTRAYFRSVVDDLWNAGILHRHPKIQSQEVYAIFGKEVSSPEEIACCIDPFGYISHLSAMEWHGLTDRISKTLFLSSPPSPQWGEFARERMRKDLGDEAVALYRDARLPILRKLKLQSILRKTLYRHASIHLGAFTVVKDRPLRVSTIGRTFLDMLRKPDLCGGIYHVLEIYEEHAERYLRLIVDEVERHGTAIDKVRTGYVLDERCGLSLPTVDGWLSFVQRGGSRKLYADAEYSSVFSDKWSLSINIEE